MTHLIFVHSSAELYGSDRSLRSICKVAADRGHRVTVIVPSDGPLVEALRAVGAEVTVGRVAVVRRATASPRGLIALARDMLSARELGKSLKSAADAIVISNTSAVLSGLPMASALRAPHVFFVREYYKSSIERAVFNQVIRSSSLIVCVSNYVLTQFGESVRRKAVVIYSGGDLAASQPSPIDDRRSGPLRIVCVGRINAWKGQDVLIRAVAIARDSGTDIVLRVVGGEYGGSTEVTDHLHGLVEQLGLEASVDFVGEVSDASEYMRWADVVAVPSTRAEPFGKVVIEAMNQSRPVIATRGGGPAEVISDGIDGFLVEPGNEAELARTLEKAAVSIPTLREMGLRGFTSAMAYDSRATSTTAVEAIERTGSRNG